MARDLINDVPNTDGASSDYPQGRTRNKSGGTPGTTGVEELFGDMVILMQKLMADASIIPNSLPDNVTNGYQLLDAFIAKVRATEASTTEKGTSERANDSEAVLLNDTTRYMSPYSVGLVTSGLRCKVLQIGDWNMNTSATPVAQPVHGLDSKKIRFVQVMIREDGDNGEANSLDIYDNTGGSGLNGGAWYIKPTTISLFRSSIVNSGFFDNSTYEDTSYNRGWVTIWYEA